MGPALFVLCLILTTVCNIVSGDTCERLNVNVQGLFKRFTSHSDYGNDRYSNNKDKCWIIQSEARIKLVAQDFYLQPQDSDGNCVDYVKVYDDEQGTDDTKRLGTFCGRVPFNTLKSSGDRLRVEFYSNGDGTVRQGFAFKYKLYGSSELDPGAYWKAGLIFLFLFIFVVAASIIAVCAAFYTQKRLKPKVILVKKLKGKSIGGESRPSTAGTKYDISGQPTPAGHLYPPPLHPPNQNHPEGSGNAMGQPIIQQSPRDHSTPSPFPGHSTPAAFTGHGPGMMEPGFGMTSSPVNEPMTSPRATSHNSRPTTASHIRFD